jgi:glucose/arabinose dehydrogenase
VRFLAAILFALPLAACGGDPSRLSETAQYGPNPQLPPPENSPIPTVHIAPAKGWPEGAKPKAAPGFEVAALASGLQHPRWLYVLPNGDVLVAETNAPPKPDDHKGVRGWAMQKVQKRAGAGVPSPNRITLLRGQTRTAFLEGLNSPFGMALIGENLYVADTDAVLRFPYKAGETQIKSKGEVVAELPAGTINHHWTKNLIASRDGRHLYVTVGSNSNAAENGIDKENNRAAILEIDAASGAMRLFASGMRNPNGLGWQPQSGALWTVVNERDELGSDLVPDYLTSVKDGGFYGWPYSYYGRHVDERVKPARPDLVENAIVPDYALGSHVAPLGLVFYTRQLFPARYQGGAFVGEHGSWNRKPLSGYKVVFIQFKDGKPVSPAPEDILTGFVDKDGKAMGRPVGVAVDKEGALLVADDVGNTVWRVTPSGK